MTTLAHLSEEHKIRNVQWALALIANGDKKMQGGMTNNDRSKRCCLAVAVDVAKIPYTRDDAFPSLNVANYFWWTNLSTGYQLTINPYLMDNWNISRAAKLNDGPGALSHPEIALCIFDSLDSEFIDLDKLQ